ncbi:MAG: peptidylprolyl isomerase [Flavobacteriaceae bacterium]|nr:peptidylprolyl isomerase [Flavobacteriaceae bacterium]
MKFIYLFFINFLLLISCKKEKINNDVYKHNTLKSKKIKDTLIKTSRNTINKFNESKIKRDTLNDKNAIAFFTEYGKQNTENKVRFKTRLGDIIIKLYADTPLHRANFIFLTKKEYFNTTCFHRVVPNFIIQGGNSENRSTAIFRNKYKQYLLPAEFRKKRKHKKGIIAQARDWEYNPEKKSTPFEFYFVLNQRGEHHLDNEHTVFGEVVKGMSVINEISKLKAGNDEWPYNDVYIKAEIINE